MPQVFFNDEWIPGGASNLTSLEESQLLDELLRTKLSLPLAADSELRSLMQTSQNQAINKALHADLDF